MKIILSIILSLALATASVQAQSTNAPAPIQPNSALLVGFVLTCVAVGVWAVLKVNSTVPGPDKPVTLILDKSTDGRATWVPVITNTITLHGTNAVEFFRESMTDSLAFYRIRTQR